VDSQPKPLHPVIVEFQELVENDPAIFMLFHQMFDQVPKKQPHCHDQDARPQVRDYQHMLRLFNEILTTAPEFSESGLVGFPINAILDWPMGTPSGIAAFLNEKVNAQIRKMLDVWAKFLSSHDSTYVLNTGSSGWFGVNAMRALLGTNAEDPHQKFVETYLCNADEPFYGFFSWDDFFTRRFRPEARPIVSPDNDNVVINPCESAPYRIYRNVKERDRFWIKSQPYSLLHMLAHDPLAHNFVGGTIYQSFLSATSYHRWHSPVSGTIVKAYVVPGTYYAEAPDTGLSSGDMGTKPDVAGPNASQSYVTAVATRAAIFIQASNPLIGLMCLLPVGMAEVSTCDVTVSVGQQVKKGDELGTFHYGGSTVCMIFSQRVDLVFDLHGQEGKVGLDAKNIWVNERIAVVIADANA